jgi:hypothetical protein
VPGHTSRLGSRAAQCACGAAGGRRGRGRWRKCATGV